MIHILWGRSLFLLKPKSTSICKPCKLSSAGKFCWPKWNFGRPASALHHISAKPLSKQKWLSLMCRRSETTYIVQLETCRVLRYRNWVFGYLKTRHISLCLHAYEHPHVCPCCRVGYIKNQKRKGVLSLEYLVTQPSGQSRPMRSGLNMWLIELMRPADCQIKWSSFLQQNTEVSNLQSWSLQGMAKSLSLAKLMKFGYMAEVLHSFRKRSAEFCFVNHLN